MTVISLHAFLDRGGDLRALPFLDILAESIVVDRRLRSGPWLREAAASFRRLAGTMLDDPERHDLATLLLWEAEAYENDDVAARFEQALPRHRLDELLTGTQEARHPHRLMVTGVEWFTCGACGDDYDEALAVVVDGTEGITYCSACIGLASLALGQPGRALDEHDRPAPVDRPAPSDLPASTDRPAPVPDPVEAGPGWASRARSRVGAPVALVLLAAALTGSSGLASAGVLPPSLQTVAHDTLAFVGIEVPDGGSRGGGAEPARARPAAGGASAGRPAERDAPDRGEGRRATGAGGPTGSDAADRAGEPGGRSGATPSGGGPVLVSTSVAAADGRPAAPATDPPAAGPTTTAASPRGTTMPPESTTTTTTTAPPPTTTPATEPAAATTTSSTTSTTSTTERGSRRNGLPPAPGAGAGQG